MYRIRWNSAQMEDVTIRVYYDVGCLLGIICIIIVIITALSFKFQRDPVFTRFASHAPRTNDNIPGCSRFVLIENNVDSVARRGWILQRAYHTKCWDDQNSPRACGWVDCYDKSINRNVLVERSSISPWGGFGHFSLVRFSPLSVAARDDDYLTPRDDRRHDGPKQ